jgi:hypothetical protein
LTIRRPLIYRFSWLARRGVHRARSILVDAARSVEASAAIMRGDPEPMRKMLDALVRDGT